MGAGEVGEEEESAFLQEGEGEEEGRKGGVEEEMKEEEEQTWEVEVVGMEVVEVVVEELTEDQGSFLN